jgi:hypothetical protein
MWCRWPCHAERPWVRILGWFVVMMIFIMFSTWGAAAGELLPLLDCVTAGTCYTISVVQIDNLCNSAIPIDASVEMVNPGTASWLWIGPVSGSIHSVREGSTKTLGSFAESHSIVTQGNTVLSSEPPASVQGAAAAVGASAGTGAATGAGDNRTGGGGAQGGGGHQWVVRGRGRGMGAP